MGPCAPRGGRAIVADPLRAPATIPPVKARPRLLCLRPRAFSHPFSILNRSHAMRTHIALFACLAAVGAQAGEILWTNTAGGNWNVAANGRLSLAGGGSKVLRGSVTNAGSLQWKDGGALSIYGLIHNTSAGVFQIDHDGTLDLPSGSSGVILNEGLLQQTGFFAGTSSRRPFGTRARSRSRRAPSALPARASSDPEPCSAAMARASSRAAR